MALRLGERIIERVKLIDDDPGVRAGYKYPVEDLDLEVDDISGPIQSCSSLVKSFNQRNEAAICDFQLTTKSYSVSNGDEVVSSLYEMNIPAVLCTRWAGHLPDQVRYRRRQIPVVLSPVDLSAERIATAFEICVNEFTGKFSNERRPWRAMIRIEGGEKVHAGHFQLNVVIPSWDPSTGLTFVVPSSANAILASICERAEKGEIVRAFGKINLGVNSVEDVYIDEWSLE